MSDLYEVGFVIDLRDDLSEEIRQTLEYMIGRGISGIEPSGFEHPLFHIEGYETAWASIILNMEIDLETFNQFVYDELSLPHLDRRIPASDR
jgi:hypothetical protein